MPVECSMCGSTGRMVLTTNDRTVCEDPVDCVGRARAFPWWRAEQYVKKETP
jgi:hypothetical protein